MPGLKRILLPVLGLLVFACLNWACQRPFGGVANPKAEVVRPDFSVIQLESEIDLQIRIASFREITRVSVDGIAMSFNTSSNLWEAPFSLSPGINMLRVTSFDEEERPGIDTLYAIQLDFALDDTGPQLPVGVGGHATTLLSDGSLLITGGASSITSPALGSALIFSPATRTMEMIATELAVPRVGHSATNIGDDLVLIVGGGSSAEVGAVSELVETVELYSTSTRTFRNITFVGDPIRRMYHTATFRSSASGPIIDLIGGTGDVQYIPEPLLATRADIRSFLFRSDTLFALTLRIGPFIERMAGHAQVSITSQAPGERAVFLINGVGGIPPDGPIGLIIDFTTNLGILVDPIAQPFITRSFHAAEKLDDRIIGLFGGIGWLSGTVLGSGELYVNDIDRSFALPNAGGTGFVARYSHTATRFDPENIVLLGGFDEAGNGVTLNRLFSYPASSGG